MPKRGGPSEAVEFSILFIPFEAVGKFYKMNATNGVTFFPTTTLGPDQLSGKNYELETENQTKRLFQKNEISDKLPEIVFQECEKIRKLYVQDDGSPPFKKAQEQKIRKGYKYYPEVIFLSENPMGGKYPEAIDASDELQYRLFNTLGDEPKNVNEMAVYLRADIAEIEGLSVKGEVLTRKGLGKKAPEYFLKLELALNGCWLGVAGAHLSANYTKLSDESDMIDPLQKVGEFCRRNGVHLLMGDFNMDPAAVTNGSHGVWLDKEVQLIGFSPKEPYKPPFSQFTEQYSNSAGNKHFMGYLLTDLQETEVVDGNITVSTAVQTTGVGVFGQKGVSGSRSLADTKGEIYYSDHPSIYVCVKAKQNYVPFGKTPEEPRTKLVGRRAQSNFPATQPSSNNTLRRASSLEKIFDKRKKED